jgi:hypothetical protein
MAGQHLQQNQCPREKRRRHPSRLGIWCRLLEKWSSRHDKTNHQPESLHHAMVSLDTVQSRKTIQMHDAKNEIWSFRCALKSEERLNEKRKHAFQIQIMRSTSIDVLQKLDGERELGS